MLLYITCKDKKEAIRISKSLLEKKLIACSNMMAIGSMYHWKGKIENSSEVLMIVKTNSKYAKEAESLIKKLHSYEIPCITRIGSKANAEFEKWANSQMK